MRRQRVLRASSAQSLCIFCACRFGLEPGIASIPRRNLTTTRSYAQSTLAATDNGTPGPAPSASASTAFTYDPNSSLTSSEQQEKWRRISAQRKVAEDRQRMEAEQQQAKQQAIWEADEQRLKVAAETARLNRESDQKAHAGRIAAAGRRGTEDKKSNDDKSWPFGSATTTSAPTGQSLGQAMKSSRPAQDDRSSERKSSRYNNSRQRDRSQNGESRTETRSIRFVKHGDEAQTSTPKPKGTIRKMVLKEPPRLFRESSPTNADKQPAQKPREIQKKRPEKVSMPDFMLPEQNSGPAAVPTTGWGAKPTEVKPLEYGEAPSHVSNIEDVESNVQDIRDLQDEGMDDAFEAARELPSGQHERRFNFSHRNTDAEIASLEEDHDIAREDQMSANLQESDPSHASTLDSFGYYEEEAPSETQHDEPDSIQESKSIDLPNVERSGIAEAAMKAPTFGAFERSIPEEESQSPGPEVNYTTSNPTPVSRAPLAESASTAEQPVEISSAPADVPFTDSISATPEAVPVDVSVEQQAEPPRSAEVRPPEPVVSHSPPAIEQQAELPRSADVPPPASAVDPPSPAAGTSNEQQTMIEQMRRMVEEYDRLHSSKAAASIPTLPESKIEQPAKADASSATTPEPKIEQPAPPQKPLPSQPWGLGNAIPSPVAPKPSEPTLSNTPSNGLSQRSGIPRLGDTGYRATPFNPDELLETSQAPAEDDGKWGLLRRRQDPKPAEDAGKWGLSQQPQDLKSPPASPQEQTPAPTSQPRFQINRTSRNINDEDADKLFEAHRATRTTYAPPASGQNESYSFTRVPPDQDLANKRCGRCGQMGHTASMCRGPPRREAMICHNCGKEGHPNRDCPEPRKHQVQPKVFIGGVSPDATIADFTKYFGSFDGIVSSRLMMHRATEPGMPTKSKGFGFLTFASVEARERFMTKGPFNLLGKTMEAKLEDQTFTPTRQRPNQTNSNAAFDRAENSRVANPFGPDEVVDSGSVIRRTANDQRFEPFGSSDSPARSRQGQAASRVPPYEEDDRGEKRRGFRQSDTAPTPVEEPKRGAREARRRQWEEPDAETERSDRGAERKGRRGSRREMEEDEEDESGGAREDHRARKAARQKQKAAEKEAEKQAARRKREEKKKEAGTPITLPEFISVQHLSQALGVRYEAFVEHLEELGYDDIFAGKTLDSETSGMIAMEYNFDPTFDGGYREEEVRDLKARRPLLDRESLPTRPPVVTIMGHVDHGKTTLLDYLRKSSVAAGEAGGITQHIGAFSVPLAASGKTVTFLDTPGHAAFLAMRQRGANVTDMVILVVAADDSVKPQTLEAIKHAKEAGVPMIVALNKVDKPEADVERCKQDLARHGVEIEDYGGDVQVVEVSGKTGKGMDALEENVVALSELLDHRAETDGAVEGWVLEATTRAAGRVATVLVRRGTLVPGAVIVAGKTWARVRTLKNEAGVDIEGAAPGMPCEVDGWRDQPSAGDEVLEAPTEQKAGSVVEFRIEVAEREQMKRDMEVINANRKIEQEKREKEKAAEQAAKRAAAAATTVGPDGTPIPVPAAETTPSPALDSETEKESGQITIPFIIKADVSGSAEAVAAYILSLSSPLIAPTILASGVGQVHESDIELASAAEGHIIAFNLPNDPEAMGNATARGVKILANNIIYRCLDDVKAVLEDRLPPIITSRVTGEAEISAVFEIGVGGRKKISIAGVKVRNGSVTRNARVRVMRGGEKVYDGTISSLKNQKKDADVMRKGSECGMGFEEWEGFQAGDQVQVYEEISEKRRL